MKTFKAAMKIIKERTGFLQGLVVGLFITSTLSYAVVSFTSFTSGTPISSSAMNGIFSTIAASLNNLDERVKKLEAGGIGKMSNAFVVNCVSSPNYPSGFQKLPMTAESNDGNFDDANNWYRIPETALYRINLTYFASGMNNTGIESSANGSTWTFDGFQSIKKYEAGTYIRVISACDISLAAASQITIAGPSFIFAIKKF